MAKKMPSSRDQKALVIHCANLTPVQEKQDQLLRVANASAEHCLHCWEVADGYQSWELLDDSLIYLSEASRAVRELIKLRKEFG